MYLFRGENCPYHSTAAIIDRNCIEHCCHGNKLHICSVWLVWQVCYTVLLYNSVTWLVLDYLSQGSCVPQRTSLSHESLF